jgi:hypothetical protein
MILYRYDRDDCTGPLKLPDCKVGNADVTQLGFRGQTRQSPNRFLDRDLRIGRIEPARADAIDA